jgi:hypothetical protein
LLDVGVTPRYTIYVGSEATADFIVDAGLSDMHGLPYNNISSSAIGNFTTSDKLRFTVQAEGQILVAGSVNISTINNLFHFNLTQLKPRQKHYNVTLTGTAGSGNTTYTASTRLWYLPEKAGGSVVKVDNLYGGILYRNQVTNGTFKPMFPFGFYADYSGWQNVSYSNAVSYMGKGFNAINPMSAFTDSNMTASLNEMDKLNLLFQYDMRGSFNNVTLVRQQVPYVKDHPSLLTWYTADEPDGWQYPFNTTTQSYELLESMDKYHPTSLVLNCQNHWFRQYTAGADIIMEDAYPVGVSPTWSQRWNTPCNATYGDCGCDNCGGSLLDVSDRVDDFYTYGQWIGGQAARKPVWAVTQAMSGQQYWARLPTAQEAWVMDVLAINHGAKGRLAWIYPPSNVLAHAASMLAKVVTQSPVMDFLVGANPTTMRNGKSGGLDVAYWKLGKRTLIGVVNPRNASVASVDIALPPTATISHTVSEAWGDVNWSLTLGNGSHLVAEAGMKELSTSFIILS